MKPKPCQRMIIFLTEMFQYKNISKVECKFLRDIKYVFAKHDVYLVYAEGPFFTLYSAMVVFVLIQDNKHNTQKRFLYMSSHLFKLARTQYLKQIQLT